MDDQVISGLLEVAGEHLILPGREINHISNPDIDHTQESLILLLELLLVEYLYSEYTIFRGAQVESLVPIRIQGSLDNRRGFGLLATQSRDGKGIRETWEWLSVWIRGSLKQVAYGKHHACIVHQPQLLC
jgi:hypothetical protein